MRTGESRGSGVLGFMTVLGVVLVAIGLVAIGTGTDGGRAGGSIVGAIGLIWLVIGGFLRAGYRKIARQRAAARQLFQTGTRATAVIEHVEQTGIYTNNMPSFDVRVRVEPEHGAPFTHQTRLITLGSGVPLPGHLVEVGYDPSDTSRVAFETAEGLARPPGEVWVMRPPPDAEGL